MHNYLTILDFSVGSVDQYNLAEHYDEAIICQWQSEDFENFLVSEGYNLGNIEWMSHSDNKINYF